MRKAFHEELIGITESLVTMAQLVSGAVEEATTALLSADLRVAESVISADETVDALYHEVEERAFDMLLKQAPVAGDLRLVVTSLRMVADLERMGDLALHIAKVARRRYPASAISVELQPTVHEMGRIAHAIAAKAGDVITTRDLAMAAQLEADDDVMDDLHRRLFTIMLEPGDAVGVESAIDVALCGRYYERFADHAVTVGRRVAFLKTGIRH